MSCELLLQDLRQKSAHKVAALWRQAEVDAAALRAGQERELAAEKALLARQLAETGRQVAEPIIRAAEIQALRLLDDAWRTLAERLARLAAGQLGQARQSGYPDLFAGLVDELPEASWAVVRVSPEDLALAHQHFPGTEIIADPAISGGFAAEGADGGHRVVSTLERRLARVWPLALPLLLREIEKELHAAPVA